MLTDAALVIVDLQNDFCPGGALQVKGGDEIVPVVNRAISIFSNKNLPIIASRDWHPSETSHFVEYGGIWPPHCIQGTKGAKFHDDLKFPDTAIILSKGSSHSHDDYSAFHAVNVEGKSLSLILKELGISEIFVCGLATDYCVKETVLEAVKYGIQVNLLTDAIRGVNIKPDDSANALKEMTDAGARLVTIACLEE